MRLIDADRLKLSYTGRNGLDNKASYASIRAEIDMQPSVYLDTVGCKNCEEIAVMPDGADYRYCPYCGQRY